jgi:glycosyltransferase involved in cell wall biosynthesis
MKKKKQVLIARDSTIPHYRIPLYNALENLRTDTWEFKVVFDPSEIKYKRFFKEPINVSDFQFPLLDTKTFSLKIFSKRIAFQSFIPASLKVDLVIVEHAVYNISYPISQLIQLNGVRFAYWGIGRDMNIKNPSLIKRLSEKLKIHMAKNADGFFAYSSGVKSFLSEHGISPDKIFVLNNTIDILQQRSCFEKYRSEKHRIKERLGVDGKKVLLFVGRLTKNKRIDFLLEAFSILHKKDPDFRLVVVGGGNSSWFEHCSENILYLGPKTNLHELGKIYVASDAFLFPGGVGLGPLQALCYDLPVFTIDGQNHKPEYEYLSAKNSVILKQDANPQDYAESVYSLMVSDSRKDSLQKTIWPSICHLTIDQMAKNFILGVNTILNI